MPKVGGHVSTAGSLALSFERAQKIEAECCQIFVSPPQQWLQTAHPDSEIEKYNERAKESGLGPNFIHATYLVNLGTQSPEHLQKSVDWLIYSLNLASKLGIQGTILHLGSHKGLGFEVIKPQVIEAIKKVLANTPKDVQLIMENSAGGGGSIGGKFEELASLLKGVSDPRLKICLDTQHAFAAGYDLKNNIEAVIEEFNKTAGLENLVVIHANDSKTEFGSFKDRHENIGEGLIGDEGYKKIVRHPKLSHLPFILEVPGFSETGPDLENIKKLKSYRVKNNP